MDELTITMIIVWSLVALYALYLVVNSGILIQPTVEKKIDGYSVKPNKKPKPVVNKKPKPVVIYKPQPVVINKPKPVVIYKPQPVVISEPQRVEISEPPRVEISEAPRVEISETPLPVTINTGEGGKIKLTLSTKIKSPEERVIRTGANPKDIEEIYNRAKSACNTTKYESVKHYQECSYIYPNGITNPPAMPNLRYDDMGPYFITGGFISKQPVQSNSTNIDISKNSSIDISGAIVEKPNNSSMVAKIDGYMNSPGSSLQYIDGDITGGIIY